jgi:hypothetical protein
MDNSGRIEPLDAVAHPMPKIIYNGFNDLDGSKDKETVNFFDTIGVRSPDCCVTVNQDSTSSQQNFYISGHLTGRT